MTTVSTLLACLCLAVSAGIAADAYVNILVQPGMILSFWAKWLYELKDWYAERAVRYAEPSSTYDTRSIDDFRREAEHRADYLLKPILTCVYCVAGQMGFWLSVYYFYSYSMAHMLICAVLTSFMAVWFGGAFQAIQKKYFPYN